MGKNNIESKLNDLVSTAKLKFTDLGLLDNSVLKRNIHSSIFNLKGDDELFQKLKANRIICSKRGHGIRVSFHFYNSSEDLDKLIEVIDKR